MRIDTQWIAYDEDRGIMTRQDSAESVIAWLEQFTGGTVQRDRRHYDCEIYQYFVGPDADDWDIYLVFPPGEDLDAYGFCLGDADLGDGRWAKDQRWYAWSIDEEGEFDPCVAAIAPGRDEILQWCVELTSLRVTAADLITQDDGTRLSVRIPRRFPADNSIEFFDYQLFRGDSVPDGVDLSSRELLSGFL